MSKPRRAPAKVRGKNPQFGDMPLEHCPCGWNHYSVMPRHSLVVWCFSYEGRAHGSATCHACSASGLTLKFKHAKNCPRPL